MAFPTDDALLSIAGDFREAYARHGVIFLVFGVHNGSVAYCALRQLELVSCRDHSHSMFINRFHSELHSSMARIETNHSPLEQITSCICEVMRSR